MSELTERELWLMHRAYREGRDDGELEAKGQAHLGYASADEWLEDSAADGATVTQVLAKLAPAAQELVTGCTRSHPHENMSPECEQKTIEARAANKRAHEHDTCQVKETK